MTSLRTFKTNVIHGDVLPIAAKLLLTILKHQLGDLIFQTINNPQNKSLDASHLQLTVTTHLKTAGVVVGESEEAVGKADVETEYVYGDIYSITIVKPLEHPDLLVATTTLGVCCGEDTSLYVFSNKDGQWELVLAQEANDYKEIDGAQGRFQYAISPPDNNNNFFVVTANVNPWCTSNWQQIRYAVLRVGTSAYKPETILSKSDTIYLGVDQPYEIAVTTKLFTVSYEGESSNPDEITKRFLKKYLIAGHQARRILH